MATIYPEHERYLSSDSDGERALYPLMAALPDAFTVFCNRRYHSRARGRGRPQLAEADFLVAHPDCGILVVEVKGGHLAFNTATDRWLQNEQPLERSPFDQVDRAARILRRTLADAASSGVAFPTGEAVAFPDCIVGDVPTSLLPERVLDGRDLENLEAAIERCFNTFGLTDNEGSFGRRGMKLLTEAVAGSIEVRRHIGRQIAAAQDEVIRLTEDHIACWTSSTATRACA